MRGEIPSCAVPLSVLCAAAGTAFVLLGIVVVQACAQTSGSTQRDRAKGADLSALTVLGDNYPRAYFFRLPEGLASNKAISYEQWEKYFERLMGIEGKVLDEELPGRSERNIEFFTRFKKRHPNQLVLLHFNGQARDPRYQADKVFAGHWLYYNGAKILGDVPAEEGETEIRVSDSRAFRTGIGRHRRDNDEIGLCELDAEGKPDWRRSEQVKLLSMNAPNRTIRVRRGQFGTKPRAFSASRSYAAAHVTQGPWSEKSNLMWFYNFALQCPRDAKGQSCADVLVDDLARRLLPGGELATFDGLEFDVLYNDVATRPGATRGADANSDGLADAGVVAGVNSYGVGVVEFCRKLRARMGPGKIIQADGQDVTNQRAFGILNGIESEGFPSLLDYELKDWSGGLNRHWFWEQNAYPPVFNYINHKFNKPDPKTNIWNNVTSLPGSTHRLVFAAAAFTNAALCYILAPENEPNEQFGIWDELDMGQEHRIGWLGKPLGPAVRMAERQPDLLRGQANPLSARFIKRFHGEDVAFAIEGGALKIASRTPGASELRFRLSGVPTNGPDLFVKLAARAQPMRNYPQEYARLMWLGIDSAKQRFMTWANVRDFTAGFYFSNLPSGETDLEFSVEGSEPLWISNIAAFAHPDAIYREFEHGLVAANPAPHPYTFKLAELLPGRSYRRLKGSSRQDPVANDGSPVMGDLTLRAKDAIFLTY